MSTWAKLMAAGRIDNDVFRWKCQAILEGMLEGATLEETKAALWDFVWKEAHGDAEDWSKIPYDAELCSRAIKATESESEAK